MMQSDPQQPTSYPAKRLLGISKKMTEGWKLLGSACPICHTPLIQSREGMVYCVGCQVHVLKEGQSLPPPTSGAIDHYHDEEEDEENDPASNLIMNGNGSHSTFPAGGNNGGIQDVMIVEATVAAKKREGRDRATSLMGQRMLEGWTMRAESCQECCIPYMSKGEGPWICLSCNKETGPCGADDEEEGEEEEEGEGMEEEDEDEEEEMQMFRSRLQGAASATATSTCAARAGQADQADWSLPTTSSATPSRQKQDDVIAFIGKKLLMGWALLAETCPTCVSPLLRDKEGQNHCPSCQTILKVEDEQEKEKAKGRQNNGVQEGIIENLYREEAQQQQQQQQQEGEGGTAWSWKGRPMMQEGDVIPVQNAVSDPAVKLPAAEWPPLMVEKTKNQDEEEEESMMIRHERVAGEALDAVYARIERLTCILEACGSNEEVVPIALALTKLGEAAVALGRLNNGGGKRSRLG